MQLHSKSTFKQPSDFAKLHLIINEFGQINYYSPEIITKPNVSDGFRGNKSQLIH